jgi:hypothetical protein
MTMWRRWSKPQARYREILREIRSHLDRSGMCGVIRTLRRATPEYLARNAIRKTVDDARTIVKVVTQLNGLINQATLAPELRLRLGPERERLSCVLEAIKRICEQAEENRPADDQVRIWCAKIAHTLMVSFSDENPSSGSARSPYRVIAGLLYEVITGERGRDLKRACDEELKAMRDALRLASSR